MAGYYDSLKMRRVPREIANFDKSGYQDFLCAMKAIIFGDPGYKMTKRRCEDFFDHDENFELPEKERAAQPEKPEAKVTSEMTSVEAWACVGRWAETL